MQRTTSVGRTERVQTWTMLSAGSSNAALFRRLPTQYALLAALHVCVNPVDGEAAPAAGRAAAGAGAPPGPALTAVASVAPPPARARSASTISPAAPTPPRIIGDEDRRFGADR